MAIIAKLYDHFATGDYNDLIYRDDMTKERFLQYGKLKATLTCNRPLQDNVLDIPMGLGAFQKSNANLVAYTVDEGRTEIYFIRDAAWVNNLTTRLTLKKDVFHTYLGEWEITTCTVEREHQPIWKDEKPVFSTTPEPIAPSGQLRVLQEEILGENINWAAVVVSPVEGLQVSGATQVNNPFVFYVPIAEKTFDNIYLNGSFKLSTSGSLRGHPYVQNIYAVPFVPFTYTISPGAGGVQLNVEGGTNCTISYTTPAPTPTDPNTPETVAAGDATEPRAPDINCIFAENIFSKNLGTVNINPYRYPQNIQNNYVRSDPKLFTSLYQKIRIISPGGEAEVALENLDNYKQISITGYAAYGANPTVKYKIIGYNGIGGNNANLIDDNQDRSLPIVNDAWNNYVAQNASKMDFTIFQRIINSVTSFGSIAAGAASGKVGGDGGLVGQMVSGLGDLAGWQDINNMPKTISNTSTSGTFEAYLRPGGTLYVQILGYTEAEYFRIANFFHRWGYTAGGRIGEPRLNSRYLFDYKKMSSLTVTGIQNEDDENEFKQIFLNGTTLWHNEDTHNMNKWYSPGPNP